MTDMLQGGEWDTEEETLASRGNGQYEPYLVVSKDEADARVAALEAENQRLREALEHIHMTGDQSNSSGFKCANIARRALEVGAD
jgi:hypothetical protein